MKIYVSNTPVPYEEALSTMESIVQTMMTDEVSDRVHLWFLEHPPLYTKGTRAKDEDLMNPLHLPVYETGRGGEATYHGPGQLIVYTMVDLNALEISVTQFVKILEHWLINVLEHLGVKGFLASSRIGVWVKNDQNHQEEKIAALGIRVRRGITMHGLALNYHVNLEHFQGIIACGLKNFGTTSLHKLGINMSYTNLICVFKATIPPEFLQNLP